MKRLAALLALFWILPPAAHAVTTVNASSAKITIYGAWLSTNSDCSSPIEIASNSAGTEVDILQSPTLATGAVAKGTYKCIILKMDTVIKFTPATGDGASCTAGTEYTFNTCLAANTVHTSKNPLTGATISCTGTSTSDTTGDQVFLYISTDSRCSGTLSTDSACSGIYTHAFLPPTSSGDVSHGFKLSANIDLTGDATGNIVFNTDNQIDTNTGVCDLEGFDVSFR